MSSFETASSQAFVISGKATVEDLLERLGLPYSIVRPTAIFGREDILINNIAWFLRTLQVFAIPGDGQYRVRPIYGGDLAALLAPGEERCDNEVINALGPETFVFEDFVRDIASYLGKSPVVPHLPMPVVHACTQLIGWFLGDIVLPQETHV